MTCPIRFWVFFALSVAAAMGGSARADYDGPDGYGSSSPSEFDVSHDGYTREGQTPAAFDSSTYVVIEEEDGETEQVDGETVIVVQEPEPIAATAQAPPAPRTVVVENTINLCPGGIWVDGYWGYGNGDYIWVDGHCVVERVNYVFVQPRWDFYSSVWWFVPGYYRPCGVYVGFGYYRPWFWFPPYFHSFYPARRPVPVYRSVARRPTTTRVTPASRPPSRRVGVTPGRTSTVRRAPITRTSTVTRAPSMRTST
ncbi:MAG TPA: hypothetical protein VFG22_06225, partial [Polyangiales bacterium]|nr:hypothetical protein [Polyangiales bacterium]